MHLKIPARMSPKGDRLHRKISWSLSPFRELGVSSFVGKKWIPILSIFCG